MKRIKHLIELYFEGATSLAEEAEIRQYFAETSQEEDISGIEEYREYFCYMEQERERMDGLGKLSEDNKVGRDRRIFFINLSSIAAAVVILISIFTPFFSTDNQDPRPSADDQMVTLIINGEIVEDNDKAVMIVDDKLAKLNSIFSNTSISRANRAISESVGKVDKIMSAINIKE